MNQKNVLVLFGGASPEHDISMASASTVIGSLGRHNVIPVYITREGKWLLYDGKLDNVHRIDWEKFGTTAVLSPDRVNRGLLRIVGDKVKTLPVDVVFPVLHGECGEDGTIQGLCELAGIPYVGCGVAASAIASDKGLLRRLLRSLKINQPDFHVVSHSDFANDYKEVLKKLRYKPGYPCFVKPVNTGSSIGISKAANKTELGAAIVFAFKFAPDVIIEKAVTGREIQIGILGSGKDIKLSPPGEIIHNSEFYDYKTKYKSPPAKTVVPAEISEKALETISSYTEQIYSVIGGKGMLRADFFLTEDDKVFFNEINTIPGFTDISMFAKLWKADGMACHNLVNNLILMATSIDDM